LNNLLLDPLPLKDLATKFMAKDFELPGLPTMNNGIFVKMHIIIANTFSIKS